MKAVYTEAPKRPTHVGRIEPRQDQTKAAYPVQGWIELNGC